MEHSMEPHKIFCFKDDKSQTYGPPFCTETKGALIREVQTALKSGQAIWAKHPQDFAIYEIGDYNPLTGTVSPHAQLNCLGLVQDFKESLD